MQRLASLFFLIACSIVISSCSKDSSDTTGSNNSNTNTSTGAGTMSAKVNGEAWSAAPYFGQQAVTASYNEANKTVTIIGTQYTGKTSSITITILPLSAAGTETYKIGIGAVDPASASYTDVLASTAYGSADKTEIGSVTITKFDKSAKIVSGTFLFNARADEAGTKKVSITEGKFDVKWQ